MATSYHRRRRGVGGEEAASAPVSSGLASTPASLTFSSSVPPTPTSHILDRFEAFQEGDEERKEEDETPQQPPTREMKKEKKKDEKNDSGFNFAKFQ